MNEENNTEPGAKRGITKYGMNSRTVTTLGRLPSLVEIGDSQSFLHLPKNVGYCKDDLSVVSV